MILLEKKIKDFSRTNERTDQAETSNGFVRRNKASSESADNKWEEHIDKFQLALTRVRYLMVFWILKEEFSMVLEALRKKRK